MNKLIKTANKTAKILMLLGFFIFMIFYGYAIVMVTIGNGDKELNQYEKMFMYAPLASFFSGFLMIIAINIKQIIRQVKSLIS